jgi:hypothetical protein
MEKNNYVEFRKERDLGAIITDTFKFIRLEWKPFFTLIFKVVIIPILLSFGISAYASTFAIDGSSNFTSLSLNFLNYFITCIIYYLIMLTGLSYIKSYINNKGVIDVSEINSYRKKNAIPFLGLGFVSWIIIVVSAFLCFFPIFYTGTVLSLVGCVYIFENKSSMDSIGRSFTFIKGNFWEALGVLIIVFLLFIVLGFIFSLPTLIYTMFESFVAIENDDITQITGLFSDPIFLILTFISHIGQQFFTAASVISIALIFFDINEQKNASGTFDSIDNLGR